MSHCCKQASKKETNFVFLDVCYIRLHSPTLYIQLIACLLHSLVVSMVALMRTIRMQMQRQFIDVTFHIEIIRIAEVAHKITANKAIASLELPLLKPAADLVKCTHSVDERISVPEALLTRMFHRLF